MARYAGLEIDATTLRLAIFEGTPKKYELVDYIEEEISAESAEERAEIVRGILDEVVAKKENRGLELASALDARHAVLREISVPYTRDDHIAKTIRFEAESYVHARSIDDVVVEYLKCSQSEDSSRLILCIVPNDTISGHLDELRASEVDPVSVELDATALATAFASTPLYSGEQNVLLVEMEESSSRLVFLEKDRVVKIRSYWDRAGIRRPDRLLGGSPASNGGEPSARGSDSSVEERFEEIEKTLSQLDHPGPKPAAAEPATAHPFDEDLPLAVVPDDEFERLTELDDDFIVVEGAIGDEGPFESLAVSEPEAAASAETASTQASTSTMPAAPGEESEGRVLTLSSPADSDPMERLFLEIERTFAAYVLTSSIDLVVVTGSRAQSLNAVDRIAEHFEVDTVAFDLSDSFPIQWDGSPAALSTTGAVAVGLGLRALGKGITGFDLRKEQFKFERKFEQLMPALVLLGLLLWAVTLVWANQLRIDSRRIERELAVLQNKQVSQYEAFFGEKPKGKNIGQLVDKKMREVKGERRSGGKKLKEYFSTMDVFEDITKAIEKATVSAQGKSERVYPIYQTIDIQPWKDKNSKTKVKLRLKSNNEAVAVENALKKHLKLLKYDKSRATVQKDNSYEMNIELLVSQKHLKSKKK